MPKPIKVPKYLEDNEPMLWQEEEKKKRTKDLLGHVVEIGDYVCYIDKTFGTTDLNLAQVQDITPAGNIKIKHMLYKGDFLFYTKQIIKNKLKVIITDEVECLKFRISKNIK